MKHLLYYPTIAIITFTIGLTVVFVSYRFFDAQLSEVSLTLETVKPPDIEIQSAGKSGTDADILAIYRAILKRGGYENEPVFVDELTTRGGLLAQSWVNAGHVPGASPDTIASYKAHSTEASSLREIFARDPNMSFWTEKQDKEIFGRRDFNGWDRFRKKYPKSSGIIRFSNVGFNAVGDQALVYFSNACGERCGRGLFVNVQKVHGLWYVASEEDVWVS